MKFVKGLGFSKGCALLTLKKPPPFVPSSLMNSLRSDHPAQWLLGNSLALLLICSVRISQNCH